MKKFVAITFAMITMVASLFGAGCGDDKSGNNQEEPKINAGEVKSSFESVMELQTFGYSKNFYKAALNKDAKYITDGDASAKFTFKGTPTVLTEFKLYSDTKYFGSRDFSKVKMITLDAFNPDNTPHEFLMSFSTSKEGAKKIYQDYTTKSITLQPGYTLVTYEVDRSVALSICDMKYAEYFTFSFYNEESEYSLYLDNLRVYETDEAVNTETKTYEDGEILLFDNPLDRFLVKANTAMSTTATLPTFSIERNPKYIASGSGSLKIMAAKGQSIASWETPGIKIDGDPVERYNFEEYSKLVLKWMPGEGYDGVRMSVRLTNASGSSIMFSPANMEAGKKGEWQELIIDLSDAKNGFESEWAKKYSPEIDPFVPGIEIEKMSAIEVFFGHKPGGWLYLDEIKLVK